MCDAVFGANEQSHVNENLLIYTKIYKKNNILHKYLKCSLNYVHRTITSGEFVNISLRLTLNVNSIESHQPVGAIHK